MAESSSSSGIGFTGLLTVLFIGLKLTKHIDWSWVWVLSPIWISVAIVVVAELVMAWAVLMGLTDYLYPKIEKMAQALHDRFNKEG